jgi:hypothetical protein
MEGLPQRATGVPESSTLVAAHSLWLPCCIFYTSGELSWWRLTPSGRHACLRKAKENGPISAVSALAENGLGDGVRPCQHSQTDTEG